MYLFFGHKSDILYVNGSMIALIITVNPLTESAHQRIHHKHCSWNNIRPSPLTYHEKPQKQRQGIKDDVLVVRYMYINMLVLLINSDNIRLVEQTFEMHVKTRMSPSEKVQHAGWRAQVRRIHHYLGYCLSLYL